MNVKKDMLQFLKEEIDLLAMEQDKHKDELNILYDKKSKRLFKKKTLVSYESSF
jgi:hypothetical protein